MRLVKFVVVLALIAGAVVLASRYSSNDDGDAATAKQTAEEKPQGEGIGIEEKYGFTGQTIDP